MQEASQSAGGQQAEPQAPTGDNDVPMGNGTEAQDSGATRGESTQQTEPQHNAQSNGTHPDQSSDASGQVPHQNGTRQNGTEGGRQAANDDGLKDEDQGASAESAGDKMQVDMANGTAEDGGNGAHSDDGEDSNSQQTSHRMTTRAQRRANSQPSSAPGSPRTLSPESPAEPPVHPLFQFPVENLVDRDMGLPQNEAEDTRTWLLMYIQKQEEVVRQTRALYTGLMQADRKRKMVLKWAKAEGHVGEMSDGEDWVDKEEWGLTEDLVKGKEEEEEEGVVQGKKTRARRREEK